MTRKEREAEELKERRRQQILDAAVEVFNESGFHRATMTRIAEQAELSKGAVYLYFESKEDLIFRIMINHMTAGSESAGSTVGDTGYDRLRALADDQLRRFGRNRLIKHIVMNFDQVFINGYPGNLSAATEYVELIRRSLDGLTTIVQLGIDDGTLRDDLDPRRTAAMFGNLFSTFGGTTSVRRDMLIEEQGADPHDEYRDLLDAALAWVKIDRDEHNTGKTRRRR